MRDDSLKTRHHHTLRNPNQSPSRPNSAESTQHPHACHSHHSPDRVFGNPPKHRPRLSPRSAAPQILLEIRESARLGRAGSGDESYHLFEHGLVARDGEWSVVGEAVDLLGLVKKLLEDWMVEVGSSHDEPRTARAHRDGHVPRRYVRGDLAGLTSGRGRRLVAPPAEHLAERYYVADLAAFPDSGDRHCFRWRRRRVVSSFFLLRER
ncbi:hypothetical protein Syun_005324 [Stephania yunnanensis]|uniref:Uncharacterized protein n=1 Tax=Stephania yunnanensis TaxID=152371 RepID=A0AAP0Q1L9_9MAGN